MYCKFIEATGELIDEVLAFRYKIFQEIYPEYLQNSNFVQDKEHDQYDPYSVYFAALNEHDEVCATVRLIYNSPIGYPTENSMEFDNSMFERDKLGEMSRIFVDSEYRNMQNTKTIIEEVKKFMLKKLTELGIEYTYGSLEKNFLRLLKIYKMNYEVIGDVQTHGQFGSRYPCILYTKRLAEDNPNLMKQLEQ